MHEHAVIYRTGGHVSFKWAKVHGFYSLEHARGLAQDIRKMGYRTLVLTKGEWREQGLPSTWEADEYFAPGKVLDLRYDADVAGAQRDMEEARAVRDAAADELTVIWDHLDTCAPADHPAACVERERLEAKVALANDALSAAQDEVRRAVRKA